MDYDVLIVGAGPAGLSLASALDQQGLKIAVIEKSSQKSVAHPAYDGREIALTHASQEIMENLDMWRHIPGAEIHHIDEADVRDGGSPYTLHFDAGRTDRDHLGYMVSNQSIRKAAYQAAQSCKGVTFIFDHAVKALSFDDHHARATLDDDRHLSARLIVAADTRFSKMRQLAGIACDMQDFGRSCIVCKVGISGQHRGIATEWFQYDHTLALLPLGPAELSVVITIRSDQASSILSMSSAKFSRYLHDQVGDQFGDIELVSERYAYPLVATYARTFCAPRFALVGDAAVGMHPVTAHGFNLGLHSVCALADEIAKAAENGGDIASPAALRAYNLRHRRASRWIYLGTNKLVMLYTDTRPVAKMARKLALRLGQHIRPVQRMIIRKLTQPASAGLV